MTQYSSSIDAAFVGRDVAAVEAGGDLLIQRAVGQQVAGELLDRERSKGRLRLKALITQSRYGHISR